MTATQETVPDEHVVLLSETGEPIGVADKATVHAVTTPLHLGFSCYGFRADGRLLVTQRSHRKRTFPSVWTNTCCGHPAAGEALEDAVRRRFLAELGAEALDVRLVLPDFRYRASDGDVEENEICPVLVCTLAGEPSPDPSEVDAWAWWEWPDFVAAAADPASGLSPWSREQAPLLAAALSAADS